MPWLTILKFVGIGVVVALIAAGAFMLRHELIEKGKNLVYAEDNAALVKQQQADAKTSADLIKAQNEYILQLQEGATKVKEVIRYAKAPASCPEDGAGDPRLDDAADWVRGRLAPPAGGPQTGRKP